MVANGLLYDHPPHQRAPRLEGVHPWTTTLSAAAIWSLIAVTLALREDGGENGGRLAQLVFGALAGALPLLRPLDGLISLTCAAAVAAPLIRKRWLSGGMVMTIAVGTAITVGLYLSLHLAIYGPHPTEYMTGSAAVGFVLADVGWKAYVLLVHAGDWYPGSDKVLERPPWIVPGCAGLLTAAATDGSKRPMLLLLIALIVPVGIVMLTFADLQPPGLWQFGNIHYFKWMMPAFGMGLLLCWRQLRMRRTRPYLVVATLMLIALLGIRLVPVRIDEPAPARMLMFRGSVDRRWDEAYFALVTITDDKGVLHSPGQFHQIPDEKGERAIAITRLFGRASRRADPGEMPRVGVDPYTRYGVKLTYGWQIRRPPSALENGVRILNRWRRSS